MREHTNNCNNNSVKLIFQEQKTCSRCKTAEFKWTKAHNRTSNGQGKNITKLNVNKQKQTNHITKEWICWFEMCSWSVSMRLKQNKKKRSNNINKKMATTGYNTQTQQAHITVTWANEFRLATATAVNLFSFLVSSLKSVFISIFLSECARVWVFFFCSFFGVEFLLN